MNKKTLIFDLDGTLIDSAQGILAGFSYVLTLNGISPVKPLTSSVIGPPLIPTLKLLSDVDDEAKLKEMADQFKDYYDLEACKLSKPYAGVCKGLEKLKASGIDLHVATNKRQSPTTNIINHFGWIGLFNSVYTLDKEDESFDTKSSMIAQQLKDFNIDNHEAIYIGDRSEDQEAASNNGLNFIGVSWGYGDFPESTLVIKSFNQLVDRVVS